MARDGRHRATAVLQLETVGAWPETNAKVLSIKHNLESTHECVTENCTTDVVTHIHHGK